MADVELTHQVFHRLLSIADRKDICRINELLDMAGKTLTPANIGRNP
jgi:hypothetical protein